jgi:hypothetical protein
VIRGFRQTSVGVARRRAGGRAAGRGLGVGNTRPLTGRADGVGDVRSGGLFDNGDGTGDTVLCAQDVGIDGAGASVEEAAVRVIVDDE